MLKLDDLTARIDREVPELTALRRDLHAHPQLAYQETYASERVRRELERLEVPYVSGVAETGVVGWLLPADEAAQGQPGVGLRADMDALPITEQTGLPYASRHAGMMHACGHDGHTTMLLGAVRVLASERARLRRPVKFIFQPAEEGAAGARRMVEQGVLEARVGGFEIHRMFALHAAPTRQLGQLGTRVGPMMAASLGFHIDITGPGGHAARPQYTSDTIVAAAQLVTALQTIVARNVPPVDAAVVTVGSLHAGHTHNIMPAHAVLEGTVRTLKPEVEQTVRQRMEQLAHHVPAALGCEGEISFRPGYPAVLNHPDAVDDMVAVGGHCLGTEGVELIPEPVMASEDFAFYSQRVPACFAYLGIRPAHQADYPGVHTPRFDFNDDAIPLGVCLLCGLALR